jgi:hypothetical protein
MALLFSRGIGGENRPISRTDQPQIQTQRPKNGLKRQQGPTP